MPSSLWIQKARVIDPAAKRDAVGDRRLKLSLCFGGLLDRFGDFVLPALFVF